VVKAHAKPFFFVALALVCLAFVFAGFAPSFYLRSSDRAPLSAVLLAHGALLSAWFLVAALQPILIARGKRALHRSVGAIAALLAIAVALSGLAAGADAMSRGVGIAGRDPQTFFFLSVSDALLFIALVTAAIVARNYADTHKRLMAIASISILFPALGRLATNLGFDGAMAAVPYVGLLAAVIGYDVSVLKKVHPATAIAAAAALCKVIAYFPMGDSALWRQVVSVTGLSVGE
jgi:hypothetical protein